MGHAPSGLTSRRHSGALLQPSPQGPKLQQTDPVHPLYQTRVIPGLAPACTPSLPSVPPNGAGKAASSCPPGPRSPPAQIGLPVCGIAVHGRSPRVGDIAETPARGRTRGSVPLQPGTQVSGTARDSRASPGGEAAHGSAASRTTGCADAKRKKKGETSPGAEEF